MIALWQLCLSTYDIGVCRKRKTERKNFPGGRPIGKRWLDLKLKSTSTHFHCFSLIPSFHLGSITIQRTLLSLTLYLSSPFPVKQWPDVVAHQPHLAVLFTTLPITRMLTNNSQPKQEKATETVAPPSTLPLKQK